MKIGTHIIPVLIRFFSHAASNYRPGCLVWIRNVIDNERDKAEGFWCGPSVPSRVSPIVERLTEAAKTPGRRQRKIPRMYGIIENVESGNTRCYCRSVGMLVPVWARPHGRRQLRQ